MVQPIPIFIGFDPRERAATNVLVDSLYQHSSMPLVTHQLEAQGLYWRERDPVRAQLSPSAAFWCPG